MTRRHALHVGAAVLWLVIGGAVLFALLRPRHEAAPPPGPPPQAFVTAAGAGTYAVGVGLAPSGDGIRTRATVLGQEGLASHLDVTLHVSGRSVPASPCGPGCYEAVAPVHRLTSLAVDVQDGKSTRRADLRVPAQWPPPSGAAIVRRATAVFRSLHSLTFRSRLASSPQNAVTTLWKMQAPDRLSGLQLRSGGGAVIIGNRRWDRDTAKDPWVESPMTPLHQPSPPWPTDVHAARIVGTAVTAGRPVWQVTFFDPLTPAWFAVDVDKHNGRTYSMRMVATAHFMHETYRGFDAPLAIVPPGTG